MRKHIGFTLIELLLVIAVISLLVCPKEDALLPSIEPNLLVEYVRLFFRYLS